MITGHKRDLLVRVIREYMADNGLNCKEMALRIGVSPATMTNWIAKGAPIKERYEDIITRLCHVQIERMQRIEPQRIEGVDPVTMYKLNLTRRILAEGMDDATTARVIAIISEVK